MKGNERSAEVTATSATNWRLNKGLIEGNLEIKEIQKKKEKLPQNTNNRRHNNRQDTTNQRWTLYSFSTKLWENTNTSFQSEEKHICKEGKLSKITHAKRCNKRRDTILLIVETSNIPQTLWENTNTWFRSVCHCEEDYCVTPRTPRKVGVCAIQKHPEFRLRKQNNICKRFSLYHPHLSNMSFFFHKHCKSFSVW